MGKKEESWEGSGKKKPCSVAKKCSV